ncbi:hypothetical protein Q8F55_000203 [Vanrija albida]|uniref:F-box domain-containing protein n=1 Tax=Vanrija albida TaxID=181172 RepID=A0ABR3QDI7_9TREE
MATSSILHLPDELLHAVFAHSSVRDAARLSQCYAAAVTGGGYVNIEPAALDKDEEKDGDAAPAAAGSAITPTPAPTPAAPAPQPQPERQTLGSKAAVLRAHNAAWRTLTPHNFQRFDMPGNRAEEHDFSSGLVVIHRHAGVSANMDEIEDEADELGLFDNFISVDFGRVDQKLAGDDEVNEANPFPFTRRLLYNDWTCISAIDAHADLLLLNEDVWYSNTVCTSRFHILSLQTGQAHPRAKSPVVTLKRERGMAYTTSVMGPRRDRWKGACYCLALRGSLVATLVFKYSDTERGTLKGTFLLVFDWQTGQVACTIPLPPTYGSPTFSFLADDLIAVAPLKSILTDCQILDDPWLALEVYPIPPRDTWADLMFPNDDDSDSATDETLDTDSDNSAGSSGDGEGSVGDPDEFARDHSGNGDSEWESDNDSLDAFIASAVEAVAAADGVPLRATAAPADTTPEAPEVPSTLYDDPFPDMASDVFPEQAAADDYDSDLPRPPILDTGEVLQEMMHPEEEELVPNVRFVLPPLGPLGDKAIEDVVLLGQNVVSARESIPSPYAVPRAFDSDGDTGVLVLGFTVVHLTEDIEVKERRSYTLFMLREKLAALARDRIDPTEEMTHIVEWEEWGEENTRILPQRLYARRYEDEEDEERDEDEEISHNYWEPDYEARAHGYRFAALRGRGHEASKADAVAEDGVFDLEVYDFAPGVGEVRFAPADERGLVGGSAVLHTEPTVLDGFAAPVTTRLPFLATRRSLAPELRLTPSDARLGYGLLLDEQRIALFRLLDIGEVAGSEVQELLVWTFGRGEVGDEGQAIAQRTLAAPRLAPSL